MAYTGPEVSPNHLLTHDKLLWRVEQEGEIWQVATTLRGELGFRCHKLGSLNWHAMDNAAWVLV